MSNDKNQSKQQKGPQHHNNRGGRNHGKPRPVIKEMELSFIEQVYHDKSSTAVAILQDGTKIYPRSPRFSPQCSTEQDFENGTQKVYTCMVRFFPREDGTMEQVADCMPKVWQTLSPDEYMPEDEWRKAIVVPLTFQVDRRDSRSRPKAFFKGKVVFPDRGSEVSVNEQRLYMLSYGGRVAYAHALPKGAGAAGHSTSLVVSLGERIGELSLEGLSYVVLKMAQNKSSVAIPKTEKDLVIKQSYKNVYELLSVASDATEDEIKRAYRQKSRLVHPDAVLPKLKNPTVKDKMNIQFFFDAVQKAYQNALDIIERRKAKKSEAAPAAEASAPVVAVEAPSTEPVQAPTIEASETVEPAAQASDDAAPQVETPVPAPVVTAPSEEDVIAAAAAEAKLSVEEFTAKPNGYKKHFLQRAKAALTPKVGGQSQGRKEKKKAEKKSNAEVLAELRANITGAKG